MGSNVTHGHNRRGKRTTCLDRGYNYKTVWRWLAREGKTLDYAKEKGEQLWAKDQPSKGYLETSTVHP